MFVLCLHHKVKGWFHSSNGPIRNDPRVLYGKSLRNNAPIGRAAEQTPGTSRGLCCRTATDEFSPIASLRGGVVMNIKHLRRGATCVTFSKRTRYSTRKGCLFRCNTEALRLIRNDSQCSRRLQECRRLLVKRWHAASHA